MRHGLNPAIDALRLAAEAAQRVTLLSQFHRLRQERRQGLDKRADLAVLGELLLDVLQVAQQMRVAILDRAGGAVVRRVAVHDEHAAQASTSEHLDGHACRAGRGQTEQAQVGRWKEKRRAEKQSVLRMEFKKFLNRFMRVPCQIVRTGRRIVYRLLAWNPWLGVLVRGVEALRRPMRC